MQSLEQFTCSGENTEKYITFTILIEKKITKNISYILQFTDSARFMATSLSNLVNNFLKEFLELNVNTCMMIKNENLADLI